MIDRQDIVAALVRGYRLDAAAKADVSVLINRMVDEVMLTLDRAIERDIDELRAKQGKL